MTEHHLLSQISGLWLSAAESALLGSVLVAGLVWAAIRLTRCRSAALRYALWLLVLIRLLLPGVGIPLPLGDLAPSLLNWHSAIARTHAAEAYGRGANLSAAHSPAMAAIVPTPTHDSPNYIPATLFAIWLVGVVFLGSETVRRFVRMRERLRELRPAEDDRVEQLFLQCLIKARCSESSRCRLYVSDAFESPCVIGFFRPKIILPAELLNRLDPAELETLFLHEMGHVRRGDLFVIWLQQAALILQWPNPVAWWVIRRLRIERELACDDFVLSVTACRPAQYGSGLIKVLEFGGGRVIAAAGLLGMVERGSSMRFRLRQIMDSNRRRVGRLSVSLRCAVVLFGVFILAAAPLPRQSEKTPSIPAETAQHSSNPEAAARAAIAQCFPPKVSEALIGMQHTAVRSIDPEGKLDVSMQARSIDRNADLWTGIFRRERNEAKTMAGEIKLSNTDSREPIIILGDGVLLAHRLARRKPNGPGQFELFATLDKPWPAGAEKTITWMIPGGPARIGADGKIPLRIQNVRGPEGIQQLALTLPEGYRLASSSEPPAKTTRVEGIEILLWQRHVQGNENYRIDAVLERTAPSPD